jgi:hypothetical protein
MPKHPIFEFNTVLIASLLWAYQRNSWIWAACPLILIDHEGKYGLMAFGAELGVSV